jgi:hypothetical protein
MTHDEPVGEEAWLAALHAHYEARRGYGDSPTKYSAWAEATRKRWTVNGGRARPDVGGVNATTLQLESPHCSGSGPRRK